jgi:hypothetical protein
MANHRNSRILFSRHAAAAHPSEATVSTDLPATMPVRALAQPRFAIYQISGINRQGYYMRGWAAPKDCYTPLVLLSGAQRIGEVHLNRFTGACRRKQPRVVRAKYLTYKRADIRIFSKNGESAVQCTFTRLTGPGWTDDVAMRPRPGSGARRP